MNEEILKIIKEKGLLLEKEIFDLLNSFHDMKAAKELLEGLERFSGQKIITKSTLNKNFSFVKNFASTLPGEEKTSFESIIIKLGLSLEIKKEHIIENIIIKGKNDSKIKHNIFYAETKPEKKLEVADFTGNFRSRYQQIQRILMMRPDLNNLVSINKISNERQNLSIIGIVSDKRLTKNKNLIISFEDLTGTISGLVRCEKKEVFDKANELQLDDIVAIKASGSKDIV